MPMTELKSNNISEAFLSSSLREAQGISHFDEFALKQAPGPITLEILRRFQELVKDNPNP